MTAHIPAATAQPEAERTGLLDAGVVIDGRFVIKRRLGGGGMADVYLAEYCTLPDKRYAVKVLRQEFSTNQRFIKMLYAEAQKQSRLEHDNVVQIYEFFEWEARYCLILGFVNGAPLSAQVEQHPQGLARDLALRLMCEVLSGLDCAHEKGVLHCDVKPANVMIDENGRARITDFGIARDLGPVARDSGVVGAGTPAYMSPEQILTPFEVDHRTDVYSAGVMFFEMLCGKLPFDDSAAQKDGMQPQLSLDPPDIRRFRRDIPEVVARIVATAMQRERDHRFAGCADFRDAIINFQRRERWRRTWVPAIIGVSLAAVAGAAALYEWRSKVGLETAQESIVNANTSFNSLCRESFELERKREGLKLYLRVPDKSQEDLANIENAKRRLSAMGANIANYAAEYQQDVQRLRQMDATTVAGVAHRVSDSSADPVLKINNKRILSDDMSLRAGNPMPDENQLIKRCPQ